MIYSFNSEDTGWKTVEGSVLIRRLWLTSGCLLMYIKGREILYR